MFQKFSGGEKVYGKEVGRGDYRKFPSKIFCLTLPKQFVEEPLCAVFQNFSGSKKVYGNKGGRGECRNFPSENFCLTVLKKFVGEPFILSLISDN